MDHVLEFMIYLERQDIVWKQKYANKATSLPISAETSAGSSVQAKPYRGGGHLGKLGLKDRKKMGMFGDQLVTWRQILCSVKYCHDTK